MENKKYKVKRENIYVGEVIQTSTIYRYMNNTRYNDDDDTRLGVFSAYGCRSMLFVPDDNNFSNDLLYNSPNYPILNMTDDDICLNLDANAIVLRGCINLSPLLEYFGYDEELGYDDIEKIHKQFFNGSFAKDNALLFGFKPVMAEDLYWHKNGKKVDDPKTLKKLRRKYEWEHRGNNRRYRSVEDGPFPREYFDVLDGFGDFSLLEAIVYHRNTDSFVPSKKEGKVKKLTRF